ncbi:hypothetical protein NW762_013744 [Fusarium torreyae]|uniref:Uncharacterized protein n=1 Tax=Fusarium torreyae TaxID=1237075 RepID=A0A9W8VA05_9HYPO|nr:hypothetical protein NW762_013744 [Fusarium torreyae]
MATTASAAALEPRTNRKADEYRGQNCEKDTYNYGHTSNWINEVTMDDTTNSVYFAMGPWFYYSEKTESGVCSGQLLGSWNDPNNPCVNLNNRPGDSRRIKCVVWNNINHDG